MVFRAGAFRGRLREVQRTVAAFGAAEVVDYRKGWFADSLPGSHETVDVVLLDVDLRESTRTCLLNLVPRLARDGVIFSQDGHLQAIVELLADRTFWTDQIGCQPPAIAGLGTKKFLKFEMKQGRPST
jgi:hypothetical protein